MFNIHEYLSKFSRLLTTTNALRSTISEEINAVTGASIDPGDINIREGTVFVSCSPLVKSEIHLHKHNICERVNTRAGKRVVSQLR